MCELCVEDLENMSTVCIYYSLKLRFVSFLLAPSSEEELLIASIALAVLELAGDNWSLEGPELQQ